MPTLHRTIVRPLITEASSVAYQDRGEYHFEVHPDANKLEIRQAIQTLFGVKVTGVWTSNHRGQEKRVGKSVGRKPHWKRAIVKLADGDKEVAARADQEERRARQPRPHLDAPHRGCAQAEVPDHRLQAQPSGQ